MTLRSEIDGIIDDFFCEGSVLIYGNEYKQMLDEIMKEIEEDKEAMCEECPGNHLK